MNVPEESGPSPVDPAEISDNLPTELPPLPTEQLLIDAGERWFDKVPSSIRAALVISPGRAQSANYLQEKLAACSVQAWYLDLHDALVAAATQGDALEILSGADLPESEFQLVLMPVLKRSEAELTRELLQQAHERLSVAGWMVASVDNAKDTWLHDQLQAVFDKVSCHRDEKGCVYWAKKTGELKKRKSFDCEISFREGDRRLYALTRPGVFSHRRLDSGARQLLLCAEIGSSDNVLDMGCGSGAVSLGCAVQTEGMVFGVDSNARAVACLEAGANRNELANVHAIWNADGNLELPVAIDVALANPPYYGDDQIAQHFVETCLAALRVGGALLVVTKQPSFYEASFHDVLDDVVTFESGKYWVVCARKPEIQASESAAESTEDAADESAQESTE
ncbi:MAG: methyltransferase [Planctomycetota bacterium]